jgi:putative tryptophan/tyrosine transport system substrate-binding protein
MKKKITGLTLCAMLVALTAPVEAQQPAKVPRIGYLTAAYLSAIPHRIEEFRQGLRELGYVEGKTFLLSGDLLREN